jgi:hypothetical protein
MGYDAEPICADELKLRGIPSSAPTSRTQTSRLDRSRNDADSINRGIEDSLYWVVRTASAAVAEEAHLFGFRLA